MNLTRITYSGSPGGKTLWWFDCGCSMIVFDLPPSLPQDYGCCGVCENPEISRIAKRQVCPDHLKQGIVNSFDSGFTYRCKGCEFPLSENEGDFFCEAEWWEYDSQVHASQQFGGSCDGEETCPICKTWIDYDEVYTKWEAFRYDQIQEELADRRSSLDDF